MPLHLPLPERLSHEGWKVKIYDNERLEPPCATVIRGNLEWRWNLRSRQFMDREPDPRDVPRELREFVQVEHTKLVRLWDLTRPGNPVAITEDWP